MAEYRLFQMVYHLMDKGKTTAPELAEKFEVSIRTIYRDIDILSAAGIPVYTTQGKGGGIFLPENFILNRSLISEEEQHQILTALQGISGVDEEGNQALLKKLGGVFQKQTTNWIEIDFSDRHQQQEELFQVLKRAIFQKTRLRFHYFSREKSDSDRKVEPLKLIFKAREWYLYAYCCEKQEDRLFKLKRIKKLRLTAEIFERPAPEKVLQPEKIYTAEKVSIQLAFAPELAYRVYENFEKIEEAEDGRLLVSADYPTNDSLYSFLLSFGGQLEVLSPIAVRDQLIKKIDQLKSIY
ncbi:helix-turn-helix transcriptional regulator [Enterococcus raffinosus]|uniref:YafY family protein n=1 Tax=Enterococcus raffinosus TaxID=71452 RepID=A0AAW8TBT3_9ENTE|nr:YafY family protein [Enterococcus raffinosus]MDT2524719.1 YafY family protein [Enterococcus raffinosus]MDT2528521.1 YafY family protein [Enterococcus raffinosus]MDT2535436.1 YafY family protein [Enterococcus raffinosus]MDT2545739.1 YafY family protein [Enterococcus raffinosus]MDT2553566.1 YafY family protein [Enterococcus raffinosus]